MFFLNSMSHRVSWIRRLTGGLFCYLLGCALTASAQTSAQSPVTVPVYLRETRDAQGHLQATHKNIYRLFDYLGKQTGLRFELRSLPWARAQYMVKNGQGLIWAFSKTQQRLQDFDYSQTLLVANIWGVAYKLPRLEIAQLESLRGKVVSVERGVSHGLEFEAARGVIFMTDDDVASESSRFKKLAAGRSEVLLWGTRQFEKREELEQFLNQEYIPSLNQPDLQGKMFYASQQPLFYDTLHLACAKGRWQEVMKLLDKAINQGFKTGELTRLLKDLG